MPFGQYERNEKERNKLRDMGIKYGFQKGHKTPEEWKEKNSLNKSFQRKKSIQCNKCKKQLPLTNEFFYYRCDKRKNKDGSKHFKTMCKKCDINYQSQNRSKNVGQYLKRTLHTLNIKNNGKLTIYDLLDLYINQKGKCALTGIKMTHICGNKRVSTNMSVDRIDNNKAYKLNNIQLVCVWANIAKNNLKQDDFIDFCKKVTIYKGVKNNE